MPTKPWMPSLGRALLVALFALTAAVAAHIVTVAPDYALAGRSTAALVAELAAGALLLAVTTGPAVLLAAAAVTWPLVEWNSPGAGGAFTAGLVFATAWAPLLAAAALWQTGLTRPAVALIAAAATVEVGLLGIASAAVFDPAAQGCPDCPANQLLINADAATWHDVGRVGLLLSAGWNALFVALAGVRLVRRGGRAALLVPCAALLALFGADALHSAGRGFRSNDATDRALWAGQVAAVALVAAGVAAARLRTRRRRAAVQRLMLDLGAAGAGSLRERLGAVLGDPSLVLLHARDNDAGWVDAHGRDTAPVPQAEQEITYLTVHGRRVAALVHRTGLLDDPTLAAEIETTAAMALRYERLQAVRLAQLAELRSAWGRIVERADTERRRLERDLHDGAQQRLVTTAVGVQLARRHHAELDGELAAVARRLDATLEQLRRLARGIFPATLDAEGLAAAVALLAEEEPRLVTHAMPDGRLSVAVEAAAYHLIEQALRIAPDGDIEVEAARGDGHLHVELRSPSGFRPVPVRVADRIGAAGGTLAADAHRLHAELPCAS